MVTLQVVGVTTATYRSNTVLVDRDTTLENEAIELESLSSDEKPDIPPLPHSSAIDPTVDNGEPLLFIYSHLQDHIMEVGSVVVGYRCLGLNSLVCVIPHNIKFSL